MAMSSSPSCTEKLQQFSSIGDVTASADEITVKFHPDDIVKFHGLTSSEGRKLNNLFGTVVGLVPAATKRSDTNTEEATSGTTTTHPASAPTKPSEAARVLGEGSPTQQTRYECHIRRWPSPVSVKPANMRRVFDTYRVQPSDLGGLGIFALRSFTVGEEILRERSLAKDSEWHKLSACDWLAIDRLACFESPNATFPPNCDEKFIKFFHVNNTNSFEHGGVCPVMSRANHSCVANALFAYDEADDSEVLTCQNVIAAGDEITVPYADELIGGDERRQRLKFEKGFICKCEVCAADAPTRQIRDKTLKRIRDIRDYLPKCATTTGERLTEAEELAHELKVHCQEASLSPLYYSPFCYDMIQIYALVQPGSTFISDRQILKKITWWAGLQQKALETCPNTELRRKENVEAARYIQHPTEAVVEIQRRNKQRVAEMLMMTWHDDV